MALKDDASLREMAWELEIKLGSLEGKLDAIQLQNDQVLARQRALETSIEIGTGLVFIAVAAMWAGVEFKWWYFLLALPLAALMRYEATAVRLGRPLRRPEAIQAASSDSA